MKTALPLDTVKGLFCGDYGYQTPKVDTCAAIFREGKLLLVQEADGRWALPGGWCEVTLSPVENTIKEAREEAGRDIAVRSVIAVQNRDAHNPPPYACGVVKIFYLCEELGGSFCRNLETTGAAFRRMPCRPWHRKSAMRSRCICAFALAGITIGKRSLTERMTDNGV